MRKKKPIAAKVGDVVRLDFTRTGTKKNPVFDAKITARSTNSLGDTIVTYNTLDGQEKEGRCNISLVSEIVLPAPYIINPKKRVNVFEKCRWGTEKRGGLRHGEFVCLLSAALASVTHVDLPRDINVERAAELYDTSGRPGKVGVSTGWSCTVRWKTFRRWVHRNAQQLIIKKGEMAEDRRTFKRQMDADLWDAIRADEEHLMLQAEDAEFLGCPA